MLPEGVKMISADKKILTETLNQIAEGYDVARDFDYYNTKLASRLIVPYCQSKEVIELGCATGEMTEDLLKVTKSLVVIEPSTSYAEKVHDRFGNTLRVINAYSDEITEELAADVLVIAGLLHHLENPVEQLNSCKRFLRPNGYLLATVPNMSSLHRRVGVKSGLLNDIYGTTSRNVRFCQPGRFDKRSLGDLFERSGYEVCELFGYMLKPFSSEQMMGLELEWSVINALFELGKEFEELASQLFVSARMR